MKLSKFKTDKSMETEGVWVDVADGLRLKVARIGNPAYKTHIRRLGKPHVNMIRHANQAVDLDVMDALTVKAMAANVLLDWEGLEDEDGNPIPYSVKKAEELMTDVPDFRAMVEGFASDAELFRTEEMTDAAGNSPDS